MNASEGNRSAYEKPEVAEKYAITHLQNAEAIILARHADKVLGKRVLDLGCGGGRTAFFLSQLTEQYVGVDYSRQMIAVCSERFPGRAFHVCDVRDLSRFADGTFDFVLFSFNGLDYVDHEGRLRGLSEIRRIMNDSGLFVFSSHNLDCDDKDSAPRLQRCYNPRRLLSNVRTYLRQTRNRKRLRVREVHAADHAILNDPGIDWSLLTYYISVPNQVEQARRAGFDIIEIWDCEGHRVDRPDAGCKATWVYYVATKSK
jgi:SAM-dependent methyltransferase